jgi:hypothetical protein
VEFIEDYPLIGDCKTAGLVSRRGSIDWLCFPRFDSRACFAALLGTPDHGRWLLAPAGRITSIVRRYRGDAAILETEFTTETGVVAVLDFMPVRSGLPDVVRIVVGQNGSLIRQCVIFGASGDLASRYLIPTCAFNDHTGALRDMPQNHLLQLLALVAMELDALDERTATVHDSSPVDSLTTNSVSPSMSRTRTDVPGGTSSCTLRAFHSSPRTRTSPSGASAVTAAPRSPIMRRAAGCDS